MNKVANVLLNVVITLVFIAGLGLLAFPFLSDLYIQSQMTGVIDEYQLEVQENPEEIERMIEDAHEYNRQIATYGGYVPNRDFKVNDKGYSELLSLGGSQVMGYVEIPAISVNLPIYHTTDELVLTQGAGHSQGTSLPVGSDNRGTAVHTVIAAHTGLTTARMFDELDTLDIGDWFSLNVLGETLWYQVESVSVVEPDDTSDLKLVESRDVTTLVTCTPYGVNSHRLLVRGVRGDGPTEEYLDSISQMPLWQMLLIAAGIVIPILLIIVLIRRRKDTDPEKRDEGKVERDDQD